MTKLCWRLALMNLLFAANIYPAVTDLENSRLKGDSKPCEPFELLQLNSSYSDLRISERKCVEYSIMVENNIREEKWNKTCGFYNGMKSFIERQSNEEFIAGGQPAEPDEFPHMGAIGWRAKDPSVKWIFKCGSSLISEKFLLTAAHCSELSSDSIHVVIQAQPEIVRLGNRNISNDEFKAKRRFIDMTIKSFINYPKYDSPKKYYDIALIELHEEVKFIKSLHPACVSPEHDFSKLGNDVLVTGWGFLTENGESSEILQVATVSVYETSVCEQLLRPMYNRNWQGFQDNQICAGELAGGVDTCLGDSGGPMQIKIPLKWTEVEMYRILGVTSFGFNCGHVNSPSVYTRVSSFIDWIEEVIWESTK